MIVDLSPIVQPLIAISGAFIAGLAAIYVPKAIAAFEIRTGIVLTENQRQTIKGAVDTAAGVLETALDKNAIKIEHIDVKNPAVAQQAQAVLKAAPAAADALGLTVDGVSRMIVGAVDTAAHGTLAPVPEPVKA